MTVSDRTATLLSQIGPLEGSNSVAHGWVSYRNKSQHDSQPGKEEVGWCHLIMAHSGKTSGYTGEPVPKWGGGELMNYLLMEFSSRYCQADHS